MPDKPGLSVDGDIEKGEAEEERTPGVSERVDNYLKRCYVVIYPFAVLTFVVGCYMEFFPDPSLDIFKKISGGLFFACGCMLMMNNDLIMTTIRMWFQLQFFKHNNAVLEGNVSSHAEKLRALQTVEKGLEEVQKRFGDQIEAAFGEIEKLQADSVAKVRMVATKMVSNYLDFDKNETIDKKELSEGLELMKNFFGNAFPDFDARLKEFTTALKKHPTYKKSQTIESKRFGWMLTGMLTKSTAQNQIQKEVNRIMDGGGEIDIHAHSPDRAAAKSKGVGKSKSAKGSGK